MNGREARFPRWFLLILVLGLVAAACGGGEGEEEPGADGTPGDVGVAEGSPGPPTGETGGGGTAGAGGEFAIHQCEPKFLAPPQTVTESCGAQVAEGLFATLVEFDRETVEALWGDEAPDAVAADIQGNDDSTVWTITLKEGWTFHNDEPVTAQSYVDAWNWGAYGPNAADGNYFFADIEGYEAMNPAPPEGSTEAPEPEATELSGLRAVDDLTIEVTLSEPFSQYPLKLGYTAFNPMPQAAYDDIDAYNEAPIGNGEYMMDGTWQHDEQIRLVRYPDYPGTQANADAVTVRIYSELNTAYNDLLGGNLDVIEQLPPERIDEALNQYEDRIFTAPSSYFGFIAFPMYQEEFQNRDLRYALSMAIDRQAILDNILKNGRPADDLVSPVIQGYREGACGEPCTFDPERAQELLEQAGGVEALPQPLEIWFNSGAGHEPVYEAVANMWRNNLGIENVEFQILPFAEILTAFENETVTGPYRLAWTMDYPSMQNFLGQLFTCNGGSNYTGYCNEEADQLVLEGNAATDNDEAVSLYQQADDMYLEDLPVIPFYFRDERGMHSENVANVQYSPFARIMLKDVEVVG